jgi:hypothetical protein
LGVSSSLPAFFLAISNVCISFLCFYFAILLGEDYMCAQKTAPKKADPVETLRNDAIDWLAIQVARPESQIKNMRLKRHVHGPLGSASETALRSFLKRPDGGEFYLSFRSMRELERFDMLLEKSGLFENIECIFTKAKDPETGKTRLDVTVRLEKKELGMGEAKKLLGPKEEKLLGIARQEEAESRRSGDGFADVMEKALESDDPLHGATPIRVETNGSGGLARAEKEPDVSPLPQTITDSDGDRVPLIPGKNARKKLENAIENGERFSFEVNGASRAEKFLDRKWLEEHGIDPNRVKINKTGKRKWEITINAELSSEAAAKKEFERILENIKKGARGA